MDELQVIGLFCGDHHLFPNLHFHFHLCLNLPGEFLPKLSKARSNKKLGLSLFTFESKALWQPPRP
jgi:hypothetical protein